MATEQPSNHLPQEHLLAEVKEEHPEEEQEISTFSYEMVTNDHPESVSAPQLEVFNKRPFKCLECNQSYDKLYNLNRCGRRHNAIRLGLFKCKVCGKCSGTKKDNFKHEGSHKKEAQKTPSDEDIPSTERDKSDKVVIKITVEDVIAERKAKERIVKDENGLFKCPECDGTYRARKNAVQCSKHHLAKRQGLYRCKICNLCSGTASGLRNHELRHKQATETEIQASQPESGSENPSGHSTDTSKQHLFKCSQCSKMFDQIEDLISCEKRCKLDRLKCKTCGKSCATKYLLEKHESIHTKKEINKKSEKRFKCSECNRMYTQRNMASNCIRKHLAIRSGLYQCKFCNVRLGTSSDLRRHELTHKANTEPLQSVEAANSGSEQAEPLSSEAVRVDALPKQLEDQSMNKNSSEHPMKISKERPFKCSGCNRTFAQQPFAIKCEWRHKVIKLGRFKCKECGKCYTSKHHLAQHVDTHGNFKCPECNISYKEQGMVTKCTNRHLIIRLGLYQCKLCNLRAESLVELKKHEATHQENTEQIAEPRPFQCDLCKKTYRRKSGIRKHMRCHLTTEPWHKCTKCSATFATNSERISHILRHSWNANKWKYFAKLVQDDEGNHLCTICKQKFIKQTNAITHVFRHMNLIEGLLKCKTCGFKCPDINFYKKHIQTHGNPEEVPDAPNENPSPPAAEKDNEENNKNKDENSSSFCYETVIKEELIIEDDAFGESAENGREEQSRISLEDHQPMEVEATNQQTEAESRESLEEQCESVESNGISQLNGSEILTTQQNLKQFECQQCYKIFDTRHSLQLHYRTHRQVAKPQYEELLEQDKGGENFTCLLCEKLYTNRYKALAHVQNHMNAIKGAFQCKICGLRCRLHTQYQIHIKTHKNPSDHTIQEGVHIDYESSSDVPCEASDLPLHCKTCNVFFNNRTNLNIHLWKSKLKIIRAKIAAAGGELTESTKIVIDQDGFFKCSKCDFKTTKQKLFKMHVTGDHNGLYTCDVCQRRCKNIKDLIRHKELHEKPRFTCDLCKKCFKTKKGIRKHMNGHLSTESRLECPKCNEKFATMGERISHSVRHGWDETKRKYFAKLVKHGDSKHLCTICDRKFINHNSAIAHVFRHMNVDQGNFECKTCGLKCPDSCYYRRHIKRHKKPKEGFDAKTTAEKDNKNSDENSSSFCYETVVKEELIIDDDAFGESEEVELEEDSRNLLEDYQLVKDGARNQQEEESHESLSDRSENTESKGTSQLNDTEVVKKDRLHPDLSNHSASNQFKCDTCQKTFNNRRSLCTHSKIHKKEGIKVLYEELLVHNEDSGHYTCVLCEKSLSMQKKHALGHVQRHVYIIKGIYRCEICGLRSGKNSDHQLHLRNHKDSSKHIDPWKDIEGVYTEHDSSKTEPCESSDLPLHCQTCNVFFNNETNLKLHLWNSKLKIIQARIGAADEDLAEIKTPLIPKDSSKIEMDENGFFNCSMCDYKSNKRALFRIHVRRHKAVELGVYTCDVCQVRCKSIRSLTLHLKSHKRTCFTCQKCQEKFENQSALKRHLFTHKSKSTVMVLLGMDDLYHCVRCDEKFTSRRRGLTHYKTHGPA